MKKIFPCFGKDLEMIGHEPMHKVYHSGFEFVALDAAAAGVCQKAAMPYILVDDWMGEQAFCQAWQAADEWETQWYLPEKTAFTWDGICWPAYDKEGMHHFWREITLLHYLVTAFKRRGGREMLFFRKQHPRPALYYYPSDIHGEYLRHTLGARARTLSVPAAVRYAPPISPGIDFFSSDSNAERARSVADKIVMALNPLELHRFAPVIQALQATYPDQVVFASISPEQNAPPKPAHCDAIRGVIPGRADNYRPEAGRAFMQGYGRLMQNSSACPWYPVLGALKSHFEFHLGRRWPVLAGNLDAWMNLWRRHRPRAVIVSNLADPESQLPAAAADRLRIPTLSIPHGQVGRPVNVEAGHVLYGSCLLKQAYRFAGVPEHRLYPSRALVNPEEYPTRDVRTEPDRSRLNLLAVTIPVGYPETAYFITSPSSQVRALGILDRIPEDLKNRIALTIKPHPAMPDMEMIRSIGMDLARKTCDPDLSLDQLVARADLVIAVNCAGSAVMNILRMGKPLFYLWTDPLLKTQIGRKAIDRKLGPAGLEYSSETEFWNGVRRYMGDTDFAGKLEARSQSFYRAHINDLRYPAIDEVVANCLAAG